MLLIKFLGRFYINTLTKVYGLFIATSIDVHRPKLTVILKHFKLANNGWYLESSTLQNTLARDATHLLGWSMGSSIAAACASLTNHHIERGSANGRRAEMTHVVVWVEPW